MFVSGWITTIIEDMSSKMIFDNIHGNIQVSHLESKVIQSPYYQRLRWIKQLGLAFYVFPGATHTRHAHTLGVMHVMGRVLKGLGISVSEEQFYSTDIKDNSEKKQFHQTMRLAGLLHDIGTFPLSHTTELAYIRHWKKRKQNGYKGIDHNHETLGSHVICNTDFKGGLTRVLKEGGIDPLELSNIIKGTSKNTLANQLVHSDVDADRMDYLLRDAYHTGVRLGIYDIDFLIRNMVLVTHNNNTVLAFKEDSLHVVESFLVNRYFWYSQIISDGTNYKFDLVAAKIYEYFLENGLAHSFEDLIGVVSQNPMEYFTFNDSYFMAKINEYLAGRIRHPMISELSTMLTQRIPPAQVRIAPVVPTLVRGVEQRNELIENVNKAFDWFENMMADEFPDDWVITDVPSKDVSFTKSKKELAAKYKDPLYGSEGVKVLTRSGDLELLVDRDSALTSFLAEVKNFIPRIYVSPATYEKLEAKGILDKFKQRLKATTS